MSSQIQTNVEFVTELMQFSRYGALAQLFVVDANMKHAEAVAAADDPNAFSNGLIHGPTWVDCAKDIKRQLDEFYGPQSSQPSL